MCLSVCVCSTNKRGKILYKRKHIQRLLSSKTNSHQQYPCGGHRLVLFGLFASEMVVQMLDDGVDNLKYVVLAGTKLRTRQS